MSPRPSGSAPAEPDAAAAARDDVTGPADRDSSGTVPARRRARGGFLRYVAKRLAVTLGLLLGTTVIGFGLLQLVPGDPAAANLSDAALGNPEAVAAFEEKWGLDKPLPVQYLVYLGNLLQGDLGTSQRSGRPVLEELLDYVPATL
jgi:peptide/nickel transport system permease protein